jgi:hypothetical protein
MSWRDVAIGLGCLMKSLGRDRQPRDRSAAFRGMWVGGADSGRYAAAQGGPAADGPRPPAVTCSRRSARIRSSTT